MQKGPANAFGPHTPTAVSERPQPPSRCSSLNTDDTAYAAGAAVNAQPDWSDQEYTAPAPTHAAAAQIGHLMPVQTTEKVRPLPQSLSQEDVYTCYIAYMLSGVQCRTADPHI